MTVRRPRSGTTWAVPIAESLRRLDRRLLGVGRYPSWPARRKLLTDAGQGRPLDPKLVRQTTDWAQHVLTSRSRRLRLLYTVVLAVCFVVLLVSAFYSRQFWGGAGGFLGASIGNALSLIREKRQAREILDGGLPTEGRLGDLSSAQG